MKALVVSIPIESPVPLLAKNFCKFLIHLPER